MAALTVVGLGGSLGKPSRSRAALALEGATTAGATTELLDLRELGLPMYSPDLERDPPAVVRTLLETGYAARTQRRSGRTRRHIVFSRPPSIT